MSVDDQLVAPDPLPGGPIGTRPHVLLIGGKDSGFASISELDIDVTLVQSRQNLSPRQTERATRLLVLDALPLGLVRSLARSLHSEWPLDGALSFYEECLIAASRVGEDLSICCNPLRPVEWTLDKLAMRELLDGSPVRSPSFVRCEKVDDVRRFWRNVNGPVILKPASGSGSRGVCLIESPGQIGAAWARCLASGGLPAIAEEYVEGPEFSAETISRDGRHQVLGITEKLTTGPPGFVELGHQFPARLPTTIARRIDEAVVALLGLVEHQWGPAHTEVRVTPAGEVVVIESQTRFGGDQIWEMVELVTGVPLGAATAAALLGRPEPAKAPRAGGAAIRFLGYENALVHEVAGIEEARAAAGVERVEIRVQPGQRLGPLTDSWSRQGYILATGADTDEATRNIEAARALVRVSSTPL